MLGTSYSLGVVYLSSQLRSTPDLVGRGSMAWIFNATGSRRVVGIVLLGNGVRVTWPFTVWLVSGSKIMFSAMDPPATLVPSARPVKASLKFPVRISAVGTV